MPHSVTIQNLDRTIEAPARISYCDSFLCRLRGLTFRKRLDPDEGLLLVQGPRDSRTNTSIHMFFVPFELSVIWINADMTVVDKILAKPWRPAYFPAAPASFILEIHPRRWDDYQVGDRLEFQHA